MRTITKNIETKVSFSSEDVIAALKMYANLPDIVKPTLYQDDDSCYCDFDLVYWEKTVEEIE